MSHTTKLKTIKIKDLRALESAVNDLKAKGVDCELRRNEVPRMYNEAQSRATGQCDYVLRLNKSPYDVGFTKEADGTYSPVFDEWNGRVGSQIGATCPMPNTKEGKAQHAIGQFMQNYAKHATINAARAKGQMVNQSVDTKGNVVLTVSGY